ncbi:hypothetical protein KA005_53365 [bacterium]|nr:hypothetical protein [bacterium]
MGEISKAKIKEGIWIRNVPWKHGRAWRTDIFKTVLDDPRLKVVEFHLKGGPIVRIPKEEIERALIGGKDHYGEKIWGPFNIDPSARTVNGQKVQMDVIP